LTNEFEVTEPTSNNSRSKFDFGRTDHSQSWIHDAQQSWGAPPNHPDLWYGDDLDDPHQSKTHPDKFSSREPTATFRLNLDIEDAPVFSKVTDYTAFRNQEVVPDFDDIITAEEIKDPEEWENRHYRDPFPDVPINRVKAPYDSTDQYLYTHFELMRQDFLIPLQRAVKGYKEVYNYSKGKEDLGEAMESQSSRQLPYRLYEHVSNSFSLDEFLLQINRYRTLGTIKCNRVWQ
jgi:hypothetical protein